MINSEQPVLKVQDLHISFPGPEMITVVDDVSFSIAEGKTLAVVGESSSGKSLTALAIMGLQPANAIVNGTLALHTKGQTYTLGTLSKKQWTTVRGQEAGIVFQEPMSALNPVMTIGRQLQEVICAHQPCSAKEGKAIAIEWLAKVQLPAPEKIYGRYPHQLSGGQKQRVMIAMAMCNHPALLIADEPTTALDVTVQEEIIRLMQYLQQQHGTALLFITHDLALAAQIADEILVMRNGKAIEYGNATTLLQDPAQAYTKALLASRPSGSQKGYKLPTVDDLLGEKNSRQPIVPVAISDDTILQAEDIKVWFRETKKTDGAAAYYKAVDDVSFSIKKGEVLGLVGESGCGKSTLSKAIMGLIPITGGRLFFGSDDISRYSSKEWNRVRRNIQLIFQDPYASLNPRMTVGDILSEPMRIHHLVPVRDISKEVLRILSLVQLPADAAQRYPHQFSGGQRQRIGIARALAMQPQLVICDESVSALDVSVQAQILNLLKDLQQELGLTYLFISHDLSVVHYMSDRIMVMKEGKIVEANSADEIIHHPRNAYTKALLSAMPSAIATNL